VSRSYHSVTPAKKPLNIPVRQSHTSTRNAEAFFAGSRADRALKNVAEPLRGLFTGWRE